MAGGEEARRLEGREAMRLGGCEARRLGGREVRRLGCYRLECQEVRRVESRCD